MARTPRPIELHLPADPNLLRVARVAVAAVAATLPFSIADIEDLRIAVDELAARSIEGLERSATLELEISADEYGVTVAGCVPGAGELPPLHPVAADLLAMTGIDRDETVDGADRAFRFTKRASVPAS